MKILHVPYAILFLTVLSTHAQVPQDALRLWMPFNGNAQDESGNRHNGALIGASLGEDRFGNPSSAVTFEAPGHAVAISGSEGLRPSLPLTMSAWVKPDEFNQVHVFFANNHTQGQYTGVWMQLGDGSIAVSYGDGGSSNSSNRRTKGSGFDFELNNWYHTAAVVRGPTDMSLFVNGREVCGNYNGSGSAMQYNSANGRLADSVFGSSFSFIGSMDDVALHARDLNEVEIIGLAGFGPDADEDGVPNETDNCTFVANSAQVDSDADGFGNACDADFNDDCVVNVVDLGLMRSTFFTADANTDLNGDGIVNVIDLGLLRSQFFLRQGQARCRQIAVVVIDVSLKLLVALPKQILYASV